MAMRCPADHQALFKQIPPLQSCPECDIPFRERIISVLSDTVIDLTQDDDSAPNNAHSAASARRQPTASASSRPITPASRQIWRQFGEAFKLAERMRLESLARDPSPDRYFDDDYEAEPEDRDIVNHVTIHMYVGEEHTEMVGRAPIVQVERLRCFRLLAARPVILTTIYPSHKALVDYIKRHWNIQRPFSETDCRLVYVDSTPEGLELCDLAFNPDRPIRLIDLKPTMTNGGKTKPKNRFHLDLYFPQPVDGGDRHV